MNCQEAQSCIQPFISHQLDIEKLDSYMKHISSCPSCKEDLEIHFMALVGLKLLDEEPFSGEVTDLGAALRTELEETAAYLKLRKGLTSFRRLAYLAALAAIVVCILVFYSIL